MTFQNVISKVSKWQLDVLVLRFRNCSTGDTTAVPIWSEQPHYKHHSIRLKYEKRVTCLLQWKGGRMSV